MKNFQRNEESTNFRRADFSSSGHLTACHNSKSSVAQNAYYIVLSDQWVLTILAFRQYWSKKCDLWLVLIDRPISFLT